MPTGGAAGVSSGASVGGVAIGHGVGGQTGAKSYVELHKDRIRPSTHRHTQAASAVVIWDTTSATAVKHNTFVIIRRPIAQKSFRFTSTSLTNSLALQSGTSPSVAGKPTAKQISSDYVIFNRDRRGHLSSTLTLFRLPGDHLSGSFQHGQTDRLKNEQVLGAFFPCLTLAESSQATTATPHSCFDFGVEYETCS